MSCDCIESIEKRQMVTQYADIMVSGFMRDIGAELCYEMLEYATEQAVLRLVHTLAAIKHHERELGDAAVYDEVASQLHLLSRRSPGLLNVLVQERNAEENKDVRH